MLKYLHTILLALFLTLSTNAQEVVEVTYIQTLQESFLDLVGSQFGLNALNGFDAYKVRYTTIGSNGQLDTASGLFLYPDHGDPAHLICYQHGTVDGKEDVPSRMNFPANIPGGSFISVFYAANGYAVSAPDYIGLGDSRGFHPYVHAATEASAGIDLLSAVKTYAADNGLEFSDKLFIAGYSQGGHAAQAMHWEMETNHADEFPLTATTPMSGPYSISGAMLDNVLTDNEYFTPVYLPYLVLGYQEVYGDIYNSRDEIFKPEYLPILAHFDDPAYNVFDINDILIDSLVSQFGASIPKLMFQDSIINGLANDPNHRLTQIFALNDTYDWAPQVPTRMFYCEADDQVIYLNSILADSVMNMNGAVDADAISVGATLDHGGCALPAVQASLDFFNSFLVSSVEPQPIAHSEISIYPNPATDMLFIDNKYESGQVYFELLDLNGNVATNDIIGALESATLNIKGLAAGMYVAKLRKADAVYTTKVVIR